jgi:hypothetical protein
MGGGARKLSNEKRESYSIAVQITPAEKKKLETTPRAEMRSVANSVTKVIVKALGRDSPVAKKFQPDRETTVASIQERMIRAAKFDVQLYEEVEADQSAMGQAMGVVVLSGVAAGIGNFANGGLFGTITTTIAALVGWYVWAFLTYFIGTRFLPEPQTRADHGELLRTIGFSSAPGLIRVFGIIPGFTALVFSVAGIWMLVAMVIAVRQALDYESTWRAIGVCVIGWVIQGVIIIAVSIFVRS